MYVNSENRKISDRKSEKAKVGVFEQFFLISAEEKMLYPPKTYVTVAMSVKHRDNCTLFQSYLT